MIEKEFSYLYYVSLTNVRLLLIKQYLSVRQIIPEGFSEDNLELVKLK